MSVASHLSLSLDEYDRIIRTYIPYYDELIAETAGALAGSERPVRRLVDLGTGTGTLALACLDRFRRLRVVGLDADAGMLDVARRRLGGLTTRRVELCHVDFASSALPSCDAMVGSYALHHLRSERQKGRFYRRCFDAIAPGGIIVSGDCMPSTSPAAFRRDLEVWYRHLAETYGRARGKRIYASWADEDTYLPLAVETRLLQRAGFIVDVAWRRSPFAVLVGHKPVRP